MRKGKEIMKRRIIGILFTFCLAVSLMIGQPLEVEAATHSAGCTATNKIVYCGAWVANAGAGTHVLYTTANGNVTCSMTNEMHLHTIKCSGCSVTLENNVSRVCRVRHTYCPTKEGVCQY